MSKLRKIFEISEKANSSKIEIWTKSLKIDGSLYEDHDKFEKGIVSLKDVSVRPIQDLCKCEGECTCQNVKYEWFNVFEEHIIAFTIVK